MSVTVTFNFKPVIPTGRNAPASGGGSKDIKYPNLTSAVNSINDIRNGAIYRGVDGKNVSSYVLVEAF